MPKKAHKIEKTKKPSKHKVPLTKGVKGVIKPSDLLPESREFLEADEPIASIKVEKLKIVRQPQEEFHKKMIMWSGISFFMVLVFVVWIFNTKQIFQETAKSSAPDKTQELGDIFQEFNSAMQEVKEGLDSLENIEKEGNKNKLPVNDEADKIDELKAILEEGRE